MAETERCHIHVFSSRGGTFDRVFSPAPTGHEKQPALPHLRIAHFVEHHFQAAVPAVVHAAAAAESPDSPGLGLFGSPEKATAKGRLAMDTSP